jgi:hypothetical protein
LVRQPLQQRDRAKHPEDEAERQSKEPATPRVIGSPLEQPPVQNPAEQHQAGEGETRGKDRRACRHCGRIQRPEPDEDRQSRESGDHASYGARQERALRRAGIKAMSLQQSKHGTFFPPVL